MWNKKANHDYSARLPVFTKSVRKFEHVKSRTGNEREWINTSLPREKWSASGSSMAMGSSMGSSNHIYQRIQEHFLPRPSDVYFISYPRQGVSWLLSIAERLKQLQFEGGFLADNVLQLGNNPEEMAPNLEIIASDDYDFEGKIGFLNRKSGLAARYFKDSLVT